MKKYIKTIILCVVAMIAVTACYDALEHERIEKNPVKD
jgi:Tfp pilus assembly protein PilX